MRDDDSNDFVNSGKHKHWQAIAMLHIKHQSWRFFLDFVFAFKDPSLDRNLVPNGGSTSIWAPVYHERIIRSMIWIVTGVFDSNVTALQDRDLQDPFPHSLLFLPYVLYTETWTTRRSNILKS